MAKFKVLLTRRPEEITVDADNEEDARQKAKDQVDFSVWESEVEELSESEVIELEDELENETIYAERQAETKAEEAMFCRRQ